MDNAIPVIEKYKSQRNWLSLLALVVENLMYLDWMDCCLRQKKVLELPSGFTDIVHQTCNEQRLLQSLHSVVDKIHHIMEGRRLDDHCGMLVYDF
jgi:hypothetical protein